MAAAPRIIKSVSNIGAQANGNTVLFELEFSDGLRQVFECDHGAFSGVLTMLQGAGSFAAKARATAVGGDIALAAPMAVTKPTQTRQTATGEMVLEFATPAGLPVQLSMPLDQAQRTIELLKTALANPPVAGGMRRN